jgi:ribosomal protein S18 acetylase RimI-like enzyme
MTSVTESSLRIVDARPDHVPFIAWVMLAAARSHMPKSPFDFLVDGPEPDVLRFMEHLATTDALHYGHYTNFIVAEVGGQPAAALSGYIPSERGGEAFMQGIEEARQRFGLSDEKLLANMPKAAASLLVLGEVEGDPWIVEWVATAPEFRRRGLIDRLMAEILDRGRTRGKRDGHISVFIGNDGAQRAYEKNGFVAYADSTNEQFESIYGCPGARHLRRAI